MTLYTLAFMYSLLSVVLLTTTLFLSVYCFISSGKRAQLVEINERLTKLISHRNEEIGKQSMTIQILSQALKKQEEQEEETEKEDKENESV